MTGDYILFRQSNAVLYEQLGTIALGTSATDSSVVYTLANAGMDGRQALQAMSRR